MIESSIPRHQQIADQLRTEINDGEFTAGDKLPSEKRLCDYFKVSRITVRQALKALENEGLIYKKQGLGAFVREEPATPNLVQLTDFNEDMRRAGLSSSSKLLWHGKVAGDDKVNSILEIPPEKSLMRLDRIRFANNIPVAFDRTWLPVSYGHLLLDQDLEQRTIYEILEDEYDIPIKAGRYSITASLATKEIADHLGMNEHDPVLEINRCSRTNGGKKVYFQTRYNNPKYITYEMELFRADGDEGSSRDGLPLKEFCPKFKF
jgi:GntR family transcriptional regulator